MFDSNMPERAFKVGGAVSGRIWMTLKGAGAIILCKGGLSKWEVQSLGEYGRH